MSFTKISDLRMNYGAGDVLKGLNFSIAPGQITSLLGVNGAGKSTLLHILAGVLAPTAGTVTQGGRVALVTQELSLFPDLTVAENVLYPRLAQFRRRGLLSWSRLAEEATRSLDRLGLTLSPHLLVGELSTSEAQLVEIARALDQNASLLILDEPTSALSRQESKKLFEILKNLVRTENVSVLFVSHKLDEVQEISDRVLILKDGFLAADLSQEQIQPQRIVELMSGIEKTTSPPQSVKPVTAANTRPLLHMSEKNFTVPAGTIIGVAGLLGSGRSEFLQTLARKPHTHYLFEDRKTGGLFHDLSSLENMTMGAKRPRQPKAAWLSLFQTLQIKTPPHTPAFRLSGGNQQKLLLGRALLSGAQVLLLDEPTRGVDARARQEIYGLMRDFTTRGGAIVWTSSDFAELISYSHGIVTIHRGVLDPTLYRNLTEAQLTALVLSSKGAAHVPHS